MNTHIIKLIVILFTVRIVLCANQRPNIILILADDLRPTIGKYGDQLAFTPNLDRLIQRSCYFTRAYSQVCLYNFVTPFDIGIIIYIYSVD